jgi:hypothetical protein
MDIPEGIPIIRPLMEAKELRQILNNIKRQNIYNK